MSFGDFIEKPKSIIYTGMGGNQATICVPTPFWIVKPTLWKSEPPTLLLTS